MNNIIKHRNFVIGQIQKSFDNELEKARSGVYADNAENRRLNRVGVEYGKTANTFKPGHKVKATLGDGRVIEAVYVEPYGTNKHTVRVGKNLYGVSTDKLEKIGGQSTRKKTFYEKMSMLDKLNDLKKEYYNLKREREQTSIDMEEELAELGEEVINNGNHPVVVKYSKALERLDDKMAKVKDKYQKQKSKLSEFGW